MKIKFFLCGCSQHALGVSRETFSGDKGEVYFDSIEFTIWQQPTNGIYTIREKLRHIWQIIRWGHPYADFVDLDLESALELRDYLTVLIEEEK